MTCALPGLFFLQPSGYDDDVCTAFRVFLRHPEFQCCDVCTAEVRPQRSAADVRRELEAREEGRNNVKLIWRALAAMASGTAPQVIILCISLVAPELMYRAQFSGYHFLPLSSSHVFCRLYGLGPIHSPGMNFNVVILLLLSAAHVAQS